jgi:DNA polymerase/3'-5' exonuclease PolX
MSDKPRFKHAYAWVIAERLMKELEPACERIIIAGSLRRQKPDVGDIELVFVPKFAERPMPGDMFARYNANLADCEITRMVYDRTLEMRENKNGKVAFGEKNKLCRHVESGIPVDLFATTESKWFNTLVVRTGPKELNQRIAAIAQKGKARWNVYDVGFTDEYHHVWPMRSEEDVFRFVGLPYAEPKDRK